jgi:predicted lipoprotein
MPSSTQVHVQLGPAINGTDLRDVSGKITLGQFENQIQYQDAATALNNRLKAVLAKAGAPNLTGKSITVNGVFQLINPKNWQVTPATLSVTG